jgi:hypothetical protein
MNPGLIALTAIAGFAGILLARYALRRFQAALWTLCAPRLRDHARNGVGPLLQVVAMTHGPGASCHHVLAWTAGARHDHGQSARLRFEHDIAGCVRAAWEYEAVSRGKGFSDRRTRQ